MEVLAVKAPRIMQVGESLSAFVLECLRSAEVELESGDVVAVASKLVSYAQGRVVRLEDVEPSEEAKELGRKYEMDPRLAELILREAEQVLGGVKGFLLTLKFGALVPNAGVDLSNAPEGCAVLPPENPQLEAEKLRRELEEELGVKLGVVVVDSFVQPLRLGTVGLAVGFSGFEPVRNYVGKNDLWGRQLKVSNLQVADSVATAAHLLMGEGSEGVPVVVLKGAPVELTDEEMSYEEACMPADRCLFFSAFKEASDSRLRGG